MSLLIWVAAAWLVAAIGVTTVFFAAKRSRLVHAWMFGDRPGAEVRKLTVVANTSTERPTRLAA